MIASSRASPACSVERQLGVDGSPVRIIRRGSSMPSSPISRSRSATVGGSSRYRTVSASMSCSSSSDSAVRHFEHDGLK